MTGSPSWLAAALLALAAGLAVPLSAQAPEPADPSPNVEVPVRLFDAAGAPLAAAPPPGALAVREDGVARPVLGVEPLGDFASVTLYFDLALLSPAELSGAAYLLATSARALAELGPVSVVTSRADAAGVTVLPATREPQAISGTLTFLATGGAADDELRRHRRLWLARTARGISDGPGPARPGADRLARRDDPAATAAALARDDRIVAGHRERLLLWAAAERERGVPEEGGDGRLLVLVSGGFDPDPRVFYRTALAALGADAAAADRPRSPSLPTAAEAGRVLAATGWTVLALSPQGGSALAAGELDEAPGPDPAAFPERHGTGTEAPPSAPTIDLRALAELLRQRRSEAEPDPLAEIDLLVEPRTPLADLAAATGGETAGAAASLAAALERLDRRYRLRYAGATAAAAAGRPAAAADLRTLAVEADGEVRVAAPGWWTEVPPATVAALRARRLLAGDDDGLDEAGVLEVEAAYAPAEVGPGRLTVRVVEAPGGAGGPRRATVAALGATGEPIVSHLPLPAGEGPHELEVALPPATAGTQVAVLVEDLADGRWGGAVAAELPAAAGAAASDFLPAPRAVHLLAPSEPFLVGRTTFEAVVSDRRTARLELLLDGRTVADLAGPPWQAAVELGELPHPRRLEAVVYDRAGAELGRDRLVVNEGAGAFRVRASVAAPAGAPAPETAVGAPVEIEVELTTPIGERVARVDFYRGEERVASRFAPPWRQRLAAVAGGPEDAPGYVRVVARLADGRTAEDVVFLDGEVRGERLDVDLVELFVVVEDADGRPVPGLPADAFRIYEEGDRQRIAGFRESADVPLTVGLAIDSSASMFAKLPRVATAAAEFVHSSLEAEDRAFVVGFGGRPTLAHDATADRARLTAALAGLRADGLTAFWEGVVYALVELQGVPGKKALVVYSDGADEDEDFSYRTALRFARRVGVPIYVVLTNNEILRTNGRALSVRGFIGRIERLTEATGGRVYLASVGADLDAVYRQIGDELRRQYLLTYYPSAPSDGAWRRVRVEVEPPAPRGARVRTLAGYYR